MAKDDRLYAKFTLDFADSPKIAPLSDTAFRQNVEAVLWSRRLLTDGFIPSGMVRKLFTPESITELTSNDPDRPSLVPVEGGFRIHDFLDHQTSKAEIEAMKENKRAAGARGGRAKAEANHSPSSGLAAASDVPAVRYPDSASRRGSKTYPETETETETKTTTQKPVQKPAHDYLSEFEIWWADCWRKQAKPDALKAFKAARKDTSLAVLVAGAQAYKLMNVGNDKGVMKMPAGWLRDRRWEDEQIVNATKTTTTNQREECPKHPGYPKGDWMNPCDRCKRDEREARDEREGRNF